jgi:SNF2 family DNA or RNA helicase
MMRYDVILVSYAFIMSQYRKLCRYLEEVENSKKYGFNQKLERPSLSIFSEIFYAQEGVKCPYLVLDEVTAVKNSTSITFAAIEKLRSLADTVIMLTGSPIDNTWMDVYAFLQFLLDHDIRSRRLMVLLFASRTQKGKLQAPKANKMRRILQLLNSFVVRRPEDTIEIPSLHEHKVKFSLDAEAAMESDRQFGKFMTIINMKSKKDGVQLEGGAQPWKRLTWAQQYAMHPALALIMHLARYPGETDNDLASADILHEAKDIREWTEWRENLEKEEKWKSARIQALIDIFNVRRDIDPKCATLIFDESVYYLDIVDTAFKNMYDPIVCFRFDGRTPPEKRNSILQHFEQAASPKVLLISRATGGVGLNITTANVVILCGPWWKSEWEKQAIKRAHRPGQTREVVAIRMQANNCLVEDYKAKIRDRKHKDNSKIIAHITRKDGVVPKVWHDLEE